MSSGLVSVRYAKALFEFAKGNDSLDQVYHESKLLSDAFFRFNDFRLVLDNPVLNDAEKRKLILTGAGIKVSETLERFIDLLIKNKRISYLQTIALNYISYYREYKNVHYGKLITADKTDTKIELKLIDAIERETGGIIEFEKLVDPAILGGFIFEVDFKRWDASMKGQLNIIRNEFIQRNLKTM